MADNGTGTAGRDGGKRILCCTDGSDASVSGLAAGLAAIGPDGWDTTVLTVVAELDPTLITGTGFAGPVMSEARFLSDTQELAAAGRSTAAATADRLGLHAAHLAVDTGPAGPVICRTAVDEAVAAIVMGTRGRGGMARALLGSVSDYVVRHAPCPVMVSAPAPPPPDGPVVVCLDDSDPSRHAAEKALHLLPRHDVLLTTVVEEPRVPVPYDGSSIEHSLVDAEERQRMEATRQERALALLRESALALGVPARSEVLHGHPGPALCRLADRQSARAIVVGTRGRGGIARALLGSVSDHVLRNAPCPVIVVGPASVPASSPPLP